MSELTSIFGAWMSLPFDWFIRSTGRNHIFDETTRRLPAIGKNPLVSARALLLNCVNRDYADLWREAWDDAYLADGWLSSDPHLTNWRQHLTASETSVEAEETVHLAEKFGNAKALPMVESAKALKDLFGVSDKVRSEVRDQMFSWRWETPLRTQLDRRQALVELDVIVTKALGLSLDDLLLMYRVSFPVLRKYEADTYYDQNGRCVFSAKSGESYLSRQEWESIKDMKEGEFQKTITETVFSDTPTERTITYKAPFFKKDREADYKEAWEMLAKKG